MIIEAAVSVGTSATLLAGARNNGVVVTIENNSGSTVVYVGDSGVTTSNGLPIPAGGAWSATLRGDEAVYGIVASGTVDVRVLANDA